MEQQQKQAVGFFFVRQQDMLYRVNISDIVYIHSEGNNCILYLLVGKEQEIKMSLRQLLEKLPDGMFLRIHKSYAVSTRLLEKIGVKDRVAYVADKQLPIGKTYYADILNLIHLP